MAARNERLGDIMMEKGLVDQEGLSRALRSQEVMGGRLGTALVDMKLVTVSTVSACLSYQRGVPDATRDALLSVKDDIISLLTRKQCSRHKVLPLKKVGKILHLAMRDPQALDIIDDIAFSVGCTVKPYVIAEIRLHLYLEIFYDVPRERRFAAFRDVDEVSTSKPRKRRTKRSLFRLPGKKGPKAEVETSEPTPPAMTTPSPVPVDAPAEEPPRPAQQDPSGMEELPQPAQRDLDLVSLDSFTSQLGKPSIEKQVIASTTAEPEPEPVSDDQSKIPTQVTTYPEPPPGEAPLVDDHTQVAAVPEEEAPPLARSKYHDVPLVPGIPSPTPSSSGGRRVDAMSETAEMYPISDEDTTSPKPAATSRETRPEFSVASMPAESSKLQQLAEADPASGTNQGYPAVPDKFQEFEETPRPPSKTQPGLAAVEVEPAPEPQLEPEEEPSSQFSFELDDGEEEKEEPTLVAAPTPETGEYIPEGTGEDQVDLDEFLPDQGADEQVPEQEASEAVEPDGDDDLGVDEFSGEDLTGGIEGVSTPEAAIRHLRKSQVRDDITRLLVSPFLRDSSLSILFLVRQGNFMALRASGSGARDEEIRAMVVSLSNPSLLQRAYKQKVVLRAPAESDPLQQMISGHLRVGSPEEVCVAPVILAGRVVNVLCIQSKPGRRFSKDATDQLQQVCEEASSAYKRLIHKTKK